MTERLSMTQTSRISVLVRRVIAVAKRELKPVALIETAHVLVATPTEQTANLSGGVVVVHGESLDLTTNRASTALSRQKRVVKPGREPVLAVALARKELLRVSPILHAALLIAPLSLAFNATWIAEITNPTRRVWAARKWLGGWSQEVNFTSRAHAK